MSTSNVRELSTEDLHYLVSLGKTMEKAVQPKIIDLFDEKYLFDGSHITRVLQPDTAVAETFRTYSLQGLVDYIRTDVDGNFVGPDRCLLRVDGHDSVSLFSRVHGPNLQRDLIASCTASIPGIAFDRFHAAEDFTIMLQTHFLDTDNRQKLLALTNNLTQEQSMQTADDGISQRVTIRKGVATNGETVVKNPIFLQPRRTFVEVLQPTSPFVLRIREGNEVALYEADGGAWKYDAVKYIAAWLNGSLGDAIVNLEIIA